MLQVEEVGSKELQGPSSDDMFGLMHVSYTHTTFIM